MVYTISSAGLGHLRGGRGGGRDGRVALGDALQTVHWDHEASGTAYKALWAPRERKYACLTCFGLHPTLQDLAGHAETHIRTRAGYVDNSADYLEEEALMALRRVKRESDDELHSSDSDDVQDVTVDHVRRIHNSLPVVEVDAEDGDSERGSENESESDGSQSDEHSDQGSEGPEVPEESEEDHDAEKQSIPSVRTRAWSQRLAKLISSKPISANPMFAPPRAAKRLKLSVESASDASAVSAASAASSASQGDSSEESLGHASAIRDTGDDNVDVKSENEDDLFVSAEESAAEDPYENPAPGKRRYKKRTQPCEKRRAAVMAANPTLAGRHVEFVTTGPIFNHVSLSAKGKSLPSWERRALAERPSIQIEALAELEGAIAGRTDEFEARIDRDRRRLPKKAPQVAPDVPQFCLKFMSR